METAFPLAWTGVAVYTIEKVRNAPGSLPCADRGWVDTMEIKGRVIKGKGKGQGLGFATANLPLPQDQDIPYGVYAAKVECGGVWYQAVVDVGSQPTLPGEAPMLEAHLLDAAPELYGKLLTVRLETYLRPEQKFDTVEALQAQVARDIAAARALAADGDMHRK